MTPYLARVEWLDATQPHDSERRAWLTIEELVAGTGLAVVTSVAWVVAEDETCLRLAMDRSDDDEHWATFGTIPRACVQRITRLKQEDEP